MLSKLRNGRSPQERPTALSQVRTFTAFPVKLPEAIKDRTRESAEAKAKREMTMLLKFQ